MPRKIFLKEAGNVTGPFLPSQLKSMAMNNSINQSSLICSELDGAPNNKWVPATSVKGLFDIEDRSSAELSRGRNELGVSIATEESNMTRQKRKSSRSKPVKTRRSSRSNIPDYETSGKYSNSRVIDLQTLKYAAFYIGGLLVVCILFFIYSNIPSNRESSGPLDINFSMGSMDLDNKPKNKKATSKTSLPSR